MKKIRKNILIWLGILVWVSFFVFCYYVFFSELIWEVEVYNDISQYEMHMSFDKKNNEKWYKWWMDESIWPKEIMDEMDIMDYKMIRYDPRDAQYLGYLVVEYPDSDYAKEVERLRNYNSTEYVWYYGVIWMSWYELLAMYADEYYWFVYALTDWKSKIIYVELIFCNYFMDLKYEEYIPREYLLDWFNASIDNPYRMEMMKKISDKNLF